MMNLQVFGSAVSGKKIIYLYRVLSKATTDDGAAIAFTTENSTTKSKSADATATKDGSIRTPSTAEVEIKAKSILASGDKFIDKLEDAMDDDELMEIWEVDLDSKVSGENKFNGKYYQGYLTEVERTANAEDNVEISLTFGINGTGVRGECTVSAEQQEVASYVFRDTAKTGA